VLLEEELLIITPSFIVFFRERYGKEVGEYRKRVVMLEEWVKTLRLALNTQTEEVRMSEQALITCPYLAGQWLIVGLETKHSTLSVFVSTLICMMTVGEADG
jgi:hypothetical protein